MTKPVSIRQLAEMLLFDCRFSTDNQQALDRIAECIQQYIDNLAPAQPEQEPVAHCAVGPLRGDQSYPTTEIIWVKGKPIAGPLFTTPPAAQRTWVGLTDAELADMHATLMVKLRGCYETKDLYRAIEQRLKDKNT